MNASEGVARLAHDRALVEREYPALAYRFDDEAGTARLEGTLVYRAACGIPTDVPVRIDFPFDYPRREPRALDVAISLNTVLTVILQLTMDMLPYGCRPSRAGILNPNTLITFLDEVVVFFTASWSMTLPGKWSGLGLSTDIASTVTSNGSPKSSVTNRP